ncbi:MAG: hypothetical protein NTV88_00195 [Candidatus Micrarchaeota archaeon]|nr:hypothetical protein [Candidatus Micrarchaeota archaeon]
MAINLAQIKIDGIKQVQPGLYLSNEKTVEFGVSTGSKGSHLLVYRHREKKPFAVIGKFLTHYGGNDAEKVVEKIHLNEGEQILLSLTGPAGSIKTFYTYSDVPVSDQNAILNDAAKKEKHVELNLLKR